MKQSKQIQKRDALKEARWECLTAIVAIGGAIAILTWLAIETLKIAGE